MSAIDMSSTVERVNAELTLLLETRDPGDTLVRITLPKELRDAIIWGDRVELTYTADPS